MYNLRNFFVSLNPFTEQPPCRHQDFKTTFYYLPDSDDLIVKHHFFWRDFRTSIANPSRNVQKICFNMLSKLGDFESCAAFYPSILPHVYKNQFTIFISAQGQYVQIKNKIIWRYKWDVKFFLEFWYICFCIKIGVVKCLCCKWNIICQARKW